MDLQALKDAPSWSWPKNAGATLKAILADRKTADEADLVTAASLAGAVTVMDDEMAALLLSIIEDAGERPGLRAQAAISLGPSLELGDADGFEDMFETVPVAEETFEQIKETLHKTYMQGDSLPKEVRRRVLEASVRAPEDWHTEAVRAAYKSPDAEWKLTAVFCMRWVHGFDKEILESLKSPNPLVHIEAVQAAGANEVAAAWGHISELVKSKKTEKQLRLAAIEAVATLRPEQAPAILQPLTDWPDEEIAEAAEQAIEEAEAFSSDEFDEDEDDDELN